jgi:hypothetical protein
LCNLHASPSVYVSNIPATLIQKALTSWLSHQKCKALKSILRGLSPRTNYTDRAGNRRLPAKLVPTFAVRECHVVSVTDPYGRILDFQHRMCKTLVDITNLVSYLIFVASAGLTTWFETLEGKQ